MAAVEGDAVAVQHPEDAGPAGVAAGFPDVVDGGSGVVHADDGLVSVLAEALLRPGLREVLPAPKTLLRPSDRRGFGGEAGDGIQHVGDPSRREEFTLGIDAVVDAHDPHAVLPTEIQEDPEFTDAAQGIAELADDDGVFLPEAGEHAPPLGTVLLVRPFLLDDGVAAEALHPIQVFFPGG